MLSAFSRHLLGPAPRRLRPILQRCCSSLASSQTVASPQTTDTQSTTIDETLHGAILYNSYFYTEQIRTQRAQSKLAKKKKGDQSDPKPVIPAFLKFLSEEQKSDLLKSTNLDYTPDPEIYAAIEKLKEDPHPSTSTRPSTSNFNIPEFLSLTDEHEEDDEGEILDEMVSAMADPKVPPSTVPCGGCGAMLHCQNPRIPGFIPLSSFVGVPDKHLRAVVCQRCHYLKHYNTALNVNVSPEEYPIILSKIREQRALVLLIVDLMDFPCSVWPQLQDIIGENRPVCVVGNKVDLLPKDSTTYLPRIALSLRTEVIKATGLKPGNIKHVALVSAKTGYGIEQLITKLQNFWQSQGDVYLVGCTNVGKSSLFNTLIKSDFCKVLAMDLVQRATISQWPGTTLNLLKFPMIYPNKWRLYARTKRLVNEKAAKAVEQDLRKDTLRKTGDLECSTLQVLLLGGSHNLVKIVPCLDHVGQTFQLVKEEKADPFSQRAVFTGDFDPGVGIDERHPDFKESRWCYDTPGTFQPDQMLSMLTEDELALTIPQGIIAPRTLSVRAGQSLFLAGLGRIDVVQTDAPHVLLTVFSSPELPLTVCVTEHAAPLYHQLLGSPYLGVPCGDEDRLGEWPGLDPAPPITLEGVGRKESVADVLLSSAGWVSVALEKEKSCTLVAHTPGGLGVYVRNPAILPFAVARRGSRIRRTPAYEKFRPVA